MFLSKSGYSSQVVKVDLIEQCLFQSDCESTSSISSQDEDSSSCKLKKLKIVPGGKYLLEYLFHLCYEIFSILIIKLKGTYLSELFQNKSII